MRQTKQHNKFQDSISPFFDVFCNLSTSSSHHINSTSSLCEQNTFASSQIGNICDVMNRLFVCCVDFCGLLRTDWGPTTIVVHRNCYQQKYHQLHLWFFENIFSDPLQQKYLSATTKIQEKNTTIFVVPKIIGKFIIVNLSKMLLYFT